MHPLVMATAARHRRHLSTAQQVRIAVTILLTVAVVAAIGVFGGSVTTQTDLLQWFSDRGISPALIGWAAYALPLLTLALVVSPRTRTVSRALAWVALPPALLAAAVMGRPRAMTNTAWEIAVSAEFVAAIQLTSYALLGAAAVCAVLLTVALTRSTPADDTVIALRRNVSRIIMLAVASTLVSLTLI